MKAIDYYKGQILGFEEMNFEDRRYWVEYQCLERIKLHTKATLKGLFRVKPAKGATPSGSYVNDYKQEIELYYFDQCVPMRALAKKPRSASQKAATAKMVQANFEKSPKGKAISLCKELVNSNAVAIDTETTDLDGVVIQVAAVCCNTREVLYSSLIYTDEPISQGALDVHGISAEMLKGAPKADQVYQDLKKVCEGRRVVAFNSDFDFFACKRTFKSVDGCALIGCKYNHWFCAMEDIAVPILGSTNRYGSISLADAMCFARVDWAGESHSAKGDALATVDLIRKLAEYKRPL